MSGFDTSPKPSRGAAFGIRGKVLGLAGLGLCALPCILVVLIWRDFVILPGLAPLFVIGCATVTAIATLIGLDAILRPVSLAGLAMGRLLHGQTAAGLPRIQPGFAGEFGSDAQQVIDELIALRAEHQTLNAPKKAMDRAGFVAAIQRSADPAQAIVVVRIINSAPMALRTKYDALTMQVLTETTLRLQVHFGPGLLIATIGHLDLAFTVPLEHAEKITFFDFSKALRSVISDLERPILSDDFHFAPQVLTGVAVWSRGDSVVNSIDCAIAALEAATFGHAALASPLIIYDDDVRNDARDRVAIAQELQSAVRNQEFELYYQPIIDIRANRPVGAEALIRWHSPLRGFVPPDRFIPLAETSGLIDPIGLWVLRAACREAAGWDPTLRVAINLGARQFLDEDLPWHVSEALESAGISPDQLEIELTEDVALVDHLHTRMTLAALRDMGVGVAIDDFGKGHSNMDTLRKMPFTTLKIDRDFVKDVHQNQGSRAICDSLITLGKGLGLDVVAQGTEQAEEIALLSGCGCAVFQGYYFARPVPAHVLTATFANLRLQEAG